MTFLRSWGTKIRRPSSRHQAVGDGNGKTKHKQMKTNKQIKSKQIKMDENQNISISPGQKNLIKSYTCFPKKNFREIGSFHLTSFWAWKF